MNFKTIEELDNHIISSKINKQFIDYIDYLKDIVDINLDTELLNLFISKKEYPIDNASLVKYTGISLEDTNLLTRINVRNNIEYVDNNISIGGFKTILFSCKDNNETKKQYLFIESSYISYILCDNKVKDSQINDLSEQLKNLGAVTGPGEVAGVPPPNKTIQTNHPTETRKDSFRSPKGSYLAVVYDPTGYAITIITGPHPKLSSQLSLLDITTNPILIQPSRYEKTYLSYIKKMINSRIKDIREELKTELSLKKDSNEIDNKEYRTKMKEIVDLKFCKISSTSIKIFNPELINKEYFVDVIKDCLIVDK